MVFGIAAVWILFRVRVAVRERLRLVIVLVRPQRSVTRENPGVPIVNSKKV